MIAQHITSFFQSIEGLPSNFSNQVLMNSFGGIEQIDVPTGFEQYTTALEMTLLERDVGGKKQKLANRVAVLLGTSPADII